MADSIPVPKSINGLDAKILVKELFKIQSENDEDVINECRKIYSVLTASEEERTPVINYMHWECLESIALCRPMTIFLAKLLSQGDDSPSNSRSQWLHLLQQDYEAREALCNLNHDRFLGAVQLHGELYHSLLVNSIPFKVLAIPLMDYLTMLLRSGFREDYFVLLHQLAINWKNLKSQLERECNILSIEVRQCLLRSRKPQILLALDIISIGFPEGALDEFYANIMKDEYFNLKSRVLGETFKSKKCESLFSKDGPPVIKDGKLPDVNVVRQRLAAKGLIPRRSTQSERKPQENDDQFYGKQIPKQ